MASSAVSEFNQDLLFENSIDALRQNRTAQSTLSGLQTEY